MDGKLRQFALSARIYLLAMTKWVGVAVVTGALPLK